VLSKPQLQEICVNPSAVLNFCAELKKFCESHPVEISSITAVSASTSDGKDQDICNTLDWHQNTNWWSSNPSEYQDKEDWLLYDLGGVMLVDRIGIAA